MAREVATKVRQQYPHERPPDQIRDIYVDHWEDGRAMLVAAGLGTRTAPVYVFILEDGEPIFLDWRWTAEVVPANRPSRGLSFHVEDECDAIAIVGTTAVPHTGANENHPCKDF